MAGLQYNLFPLDFFHSPQPIALDATHTATLPLRTRKRNNVDNLDEQPNGKKNIRDKKMIRAPPHMAKKKEGSVNDQADHGKYLKTLTKLFFFLVGFRRDD